MTPDIPQIIEVPLNQILLNDKNPRGFINLAAVNTLSASMSVEGQKNEIKLRLLETGQYMVVGGDHRVLAARKLGWTTIRAIVLDIKPKQAFLEAYLDNQGQPMGWYTDYMAIEAAWAEGVPGQMTQKAVADRLMLDDSRVGKALKLLPLLSFKARQVILVNYQNAGYLIPESCALRLRDLDTGSPTDQGVIEAAIQVVIDRQMTEAQVQKLVAWIQKGNSPESFPVSGKTEVQKGSKNQRFDPNDSLADIWKGLPKGAKIHKTPKGYQLSWKLSEAEAPAAVKGALAGLAGTKGADTNAQSASPVGDNLGQLNHVPQHVASAQTQVNPSVLTTNRIIHQAATTTKIYLFRDLLAGTNVIHKIQQKIAKGETPTLLESFVLGSYRIGQGARWLWKEMIKPSLKSFSEKFKKTFGKTLYYLFIALVLGYLVWKVWPVFQAVLHPIHWIESKFHGESKPEEESTSVPTPQPVTSTVMPKVEAVMNRFIPEKKTVKPVPVVTYQPAISFNTTVSTLNPSGTLYDPQYLESEIQALPRNVNWVVKDFPLTPDEGMPGDVAVSRMQDLMDPDKYTMMIGGGKQIITAVYATNTTLRINYKSADAINGLFNTGGGQVNVIWEDVMVIHVNELESEKAQSSNLSTSAPSNNSIYQYSLIVSGSKNPLTIQCTSAENLEHLVSTMEYFIRSSRLAHDTLLAGIPYPSQGLLLNNDCLVNALWADSPMGKAGVQLGDMVWSVEKNAPYPPDRKKLEAQLAALSPGPHMIYLVSPAEREKAQIEMTRNHAVSLNPKRKKMYLQL